MPNIDNSEAYDTVRWILDTADMGFFIVTASPRTQWKISRLYQSPRVAVYDFSQKSMPFSSSDLDEWTQTHRNNDVFFVLNMQIAFMDEKGQLSEDAMRSFNMSRDILASKKKVWGFFMTEDTDHSLSTFAYDFYSYIRLKAHFQDETASNVESGLIIEFEAQNDVLQIKEILSRYKDMEDRLMALSVEDTLDKQLISSAISLMNIAALYRNCADYENAHRLLARIKMIREKVLGMEHPDTAMTYNNIAVVYEHQGDYPKALELYEKALAIHEKAMGKNHPHTALIYNNIADMQSRQRNTKLSPWTTLIRAIIPKRWRG